MERPREVIWFERIVLATIALGILNSWLMWPQSTALRGPAFALIVQSLTLVVMLVLTLFVSRRRSNIAKWILIVLAALGLPIFFRQLTSGQLQGAVVISLTQAIAQIAAYALLFTPNSRRWFGREAAANQ